MENISTILVVIQHQHAASKRKQSWWAVTIMEISLLFFYYVLCVWRYPSTMPWFSINLKYMSMYHLTGPFIRLKNVRDRWILREWVWIRQNCCLHTCSESLRWLWTAKFQTNQQLDILIIMSIVVLCWENVKDGAALQVQFLKNFWTGKPFRCNFCFAKKCLCANKSKCL